MSPSLLSSRADSLNAKVGAITLAVAAFLTLLLSHTASSLAPMRLLTLTTAAFAVWAFADEMGSKKPLNRAGLVCFAIAAITKVQLCLGLGTAFVGRYYLLYAAFLLLAVLFWSVALLHRQRGLKIVGAVGVLATLAPIVAIVVGHLVVGVGAAVGVGALLSVSDGAPMDLSFVTLVERIFGLWGYAAAWLLWRGHVVGAVTVGRVERPAHEV
ncbi:MAG: hypothetical protein NT062_01815 [Proteobacteria bacterium]|nr:hypothetical protein [Pseudomonadota bacterium]